MAAEYRPLCTAPSLPSTVSRHARAPRFVFATFLTVILVLLGTVTLHAPPRLSAPRTAGAGGGLQGWRRLTELGDYNDTIRIGGQVKTTGTGKEAVTVEIINASKNSYSDNGVKQNKTIVTATVWNIVKPQILKSTLKANLRINTETPEVAKAADKKVMTAKAPVNKPAVNKVHAATEHSCGPLKFAALNALFPKTALATFPGSGNTWTRHLIQQLTGYYTGAVYNDLTLKRKGFPGEYIHDGRVIAIKTHLTSKIELGRYAKAVIVMRSPYDALKAEYNRLAKGHTGQRDSINAQDPKWRKYLQKKMVHWKNWHRQWLLGFNGKKLILQYEDMIADLNLPLQQLCKFLDMKSVCSEKRIQCVIGNSTGNFKRKKKAEHKDPYTDEDRAILEQYKKEVYNILNTCVDKGQCIGHRIKHLDWNE